MKHGIYYAYWEQEWYGDYIYYIKKVSKLGFDILEIAAQQILDYSDEELAKIKACADECGITLTAGIGMPADKYISSPDPEVKERSYKFFVEIFKALSKLDIKVLAGSLYSYWPMDYTKPVDKEGDWKRGVEGIREVSFEAEKYGIDLCLEVLNRFESHLLNTAEEGVAFVKEVDRPNVKLHLDTFHMNIEEDNIGAAIRLAGPWLGHFHTGECNRKVPGKGRTPWAEIGQALRDVNYTGAVVMEPFVRTGGTVGAAIRVWHDLSDNADEDKLDQDAKQSLEFCRFVFGN